MGRLTKIFALCAVALLTSIPGFSQDLPKSEFSAGYDFRRLTGDSRQNLPSGWYGEIAWKVTPAVATVGQITGHYQNLGPASLHTVGGGVRVFAEHAKAAPFAEILVGLALLSSSSTAQLPPDQSGPVPLGLRGSVGSALLQVGGGLDLMLDSPIGIQIRGDFVRTGDDIGNMLRVGAGLVLRFDR